MSVITSVVVVGEGSNSRFDRWTAKLGRVMWESQNWDEEAKRPKDDDPELCYEPLPNHIGKVYLSGGGKVPSGAVWWLGLNRADMDRLIEHVSRHREFNGVVIWYWSEFGDSETVIIGKGVVSE